MFVVSVLAKSPSGGKSPRKRLPANPRSHANVRRNVPECFRSWFDSVESVGISAGASTPDNLIKDVIAKVKLFSKINVKEEIYG